MAYSIYAQTGRISYDVNEYIADTRADIASLPLNDTPGSLCFVIEDSSIFILSNRKEWKEVLD